MFPERDPKMFPERTPRHGRGVESEKTEEKVLTPIDQKMQEIKSSTAITLSAIGVVVTIAVAACVLYTPDISMRELSLYAMVEILFVACMAATYRGNAMEQELFLRFTSPEAKSKR